MSSKTQRPTINQINGFVFRNPVLAYYLAWRENTNKLDRKWSEDISDPNRRGLQRKTFRGNCIYGNLLKTVAAFSLNDVTDYNYKRDNFTFDLDVQWTIYFDVDGVWIKARLPWNDNKESWETSTYFSKRLRANVPFEKELLAPVVKQYNDQFFFPENTLLGAIQRKRNRSKRQSIEYFKDSLRNPLKTYPVDIDDSEVQRSMRRKLKRSKNIISEVQLTREMFTQLMKRERSQLPLRAKRMDISWAWDMDGDIDEIETEFFNQMEENVVYVD